jgi:YtcA family
MTGGSEGARSLRWLAVALLSCAACDPLVDVAGAFFPGWMLCILGGVIATVIARYLLARARLEPTLGPLLIIYPSLAAAISFALWLGFYRRVP